MSKFRNNSKSKPTVKVLESCLPEVIISSDALVKMQLFCEGVNDEVGWLGTAYQKKNEIYIKDVFLFEQEVHSTTTEITPEGLAEFGTKLLEEEDGMNLWNNLKVWGHSHENMGVTPSHQDNKQMETFADGGHDWFIRIIANKKGELNVDLYCYTLGIIYNEIPWEEEVTDEEYNVQLQINNLYKQLDEFESKRIETFKADIEEEIKQKVKKKQTSTYWTNTRTGTITGIGNTAKSTENTLTCKIKTVVDALVYFKEDPAILMDIGECETIFEVTGVLELFGYAHDFTRDEVLTIWSAGKKLFYQSFTEKENKELKSKENNKGGNIGA